MTTSAAAKRAPNPIAIRWGRRIRMQREAYKIARADGTARSMTQQELATAVGVTQAAVTQWERGEVAPSVRNQLRIANALRTDARLLFEYPQDVA